MTDLATRINAWLTPARRQAIYQLFLVAGILVTAFSPVMSTQVAQWTSVALAAGTVASLLLGSVVTRAPQWPVIYRGMAALVAALVGASVLSGSMADVALRVLQAAVTVAPLIMILARTDTRTVDGSPVAEVVLTDLPVAPVTPVPATPLYATHVDGKVITDWTDGTQSTGRGA